MILPDDFFAEADRALDAEGEMPARSAISRAYYGAFHHARQYAEQYGFVERAEGQGGTHKQLRAFLLQQTKNEPALNLVARHLKTLHEQRCRADYDLDHDISTADAADLRRRAEKAVNAIPEARSA